MKLTAIALTALTASLSQAASIPDSKLTTRQTRSREPIEPDLYATLECYTRFAAASQGAFYYHDTVCPSPPFGASLIRRVETSTNSAEIYIFAHDSAKELILSFAGLSSIYDASVDSSFSFTPLTTSPGCNGCQVHSGVLEIWRNLEDGLKKALAELEPKFPHYKIILVGHSLGGSLATLAYTELKSNVISIEKTYTMGALRVGNQAYADFTDGLAGASDTHLGDLIRITHGVDSLPGLPSTPMGFRHTRTEIYQVEASPDSDKQSPQTTFRCFGQEAPDCIRGNAAAVNHIHHTRYTGVLMVDDRECNHPKTNKASLQ